MSAPVIMPRSSSDSIAPAASRPRWSIVLAGGAGTRLGNYVEKRFGEARPEQYCAFSGTRSMVQHTVDRATRVCDVERTSIVIAAEHAGWARPQLDGRGAQLIVQPADRGTAAGVFLALARIRASEPDAVVIVLPSDHFVEPERRFVEVIAAAVAAAEAEVERIVVVGAVPDAVETEYGYIEPRSSRASLAAARVNSFIDKPSREEAVRAIACGCLWNTMIVAATAEALWQAGRASVPATVAGFDRLVDAIDTPFEAAVLDGIYRRLPNASFSADVVRRAPDRCLMVRMDGVEWSDWGRVDRIERTIARLKKAQRRATRSGVARG